MNVARTAKFVLVGGAAAAWLAAAATSGSRSGGQPSVADVSPVDARASELAAEVARLHDWQKPVAPPRRTGRNLFSFGRTERPTAAGEHKPPAQHETPAQAGPAAPLLKLAGIGEDVTPAGVVRTAIISTAGELFLAKEGDEVTARYRVSRISSEVVELSDLSDGSTRRLVLR